MYDVEVVFEFFGIGIGFVNWCVVWWWNVVEQLGGCVQVCIYVGNGQMVWFGFMVWVGFW